MILALLHAAALAWPGQFEPRDWSPELDDSAPFGAYRDQEGDDAYTPLVDEDGCPLLLTDEICSSPAFWQSACGARELEKPETVCQDAFWHYLETTSDPLPAVDVVDPRTGETTRVLFEAYDPARITWSGFHSLYAPYLLRLAHPRDGMEAFRVGRELSWWDNNCSVQSCAELAYERYEDYSRYEARIASALGRGDWGAVYAAAFDADGIARRTLTSRTGLPLDPLPIDDDRSRYLDGFTTGKRGPLYGWSASGAPEDFDPELPVEVGVPFLLHALGELPAGAADPQDLVDPDVALAFAEDCGFDPLSGWVRCDAGAGALSLEIRDAFNPHVRPFDPARVARIPGQSTWPPAGVDRWDFHQQTGDALSGVATEEQLLWLEDRQEDFARLQRRRERLWLDLLGAAYAPVNPLCNVVDCEDPVVVVPELLADLEAIHAEQAALLTAFDLSGCLAAAPTPCDWSPRWPALAFVDHYQSAREDLFAECVARTGDDFSVLRDEDPEDASPYWLVAEDASLREAIGGGVCDPIDGLASPGPACQVRDDYLRNERTVLSYFDTVDAWAGAWAHRYAFPVDQDSGRPTIAGTSGDRSSLGDDDFGASVAYEVGWDLPELSDLPCALGAEIHGQLQVGTKVFGYRVPRPYVGAAPPGVDDGFAERRRSGNLVFADFLVGLGEGGGASWTVFDLLGFQLYVDAEGEEPTGDLTWHYVAEPDPVQDSYDLLDEETTLMVGPVPINLSIGVVGAVGYTARAELQASRCPDDAPWAGITGTARFEPFASASAVASASAGITGLAAIGVEANLTIVRISLPLQAEVTATWDPDTLRPSPTGPDQGLAVSATADLEVALLGGRVRAFVEVLFKEYARTVFAFDGWRDSRSLLDLGLTADLAGVVSALGLAGPADPAPVHEVSRVRLHDDRGTCEPWERPDPDVYVDFDDASLSSGTLSAVRGTASWDTAGATPSLQGRHGQAVAGPLAPLSPMIFPLGDQLSYSLHFRPDPAAPGGTLLAHGTGGHAARGVALRLTDDGRVTVEVACEQGGLEVLTDAEAVSSGTWHHAMWMARSNDVQLWVDGRYAGRLDDCTASFSDVLVHLGRLVRDGVASDPFAGRLDELGYWASDPLTGFDVADALAQGEAGLPLWGEGAAPLSGITGLQGRLDGAELVLGWTNPPSLASPGGYDEVVLRVGVDGYPGTTAGGVAGYAGVAEATTLTVPPAETLFVATWARGPAGIRPGPQLQVSQAAPALSDVTGLVAHAGTDEVRLRWDLPADPRVARVLVVRDDEPVTEPSDGRTVLSSRATVALDVGLVPGTTVHYRVWTRDGVGRLSPGVTVQATPSLATPLDFFPPGPVLGARAEALPTGTVLSWSLPADPDPLKVEVRRVDGGVMRRVLGETVDARFRDDTALLGIRAAYELTTIDVQGLRGPTVVVSASPREIATPSGFSAEVVDGTAALAWLASDPTAPEMVVVRTVGSPAEVPSEGVEVCRVAATTGACTDLDPPVATPLAYAAFSRDSRGALSRPATDTAQLEAPPGPAGPDRVAHVGERVVLDPDGVRVAEPVAWSTSTPDVFLSADGPRAWFRPVAPGVFVVRLLATATDGTPVDDTVTVTVLPYDGEAAGWQTPPFLDHLFPETGPFALVADGDLAWGTSDDGTRLVAVDADGEVVVDAAGTWPSIFGIDGDLLLGTSSGDLVAIDVSIPDQPVVAFTEADVVVSAPSVAAGVAVLPHRSQTRIALREIGATGTSLLGEVTLADPPDAAALSPDGTVLAVGTNTTLHLFDVSTWPAEELDTVPGNVDLLAWRGTEVWFASRPPSFTGPSELRRVDAADPTAVAVTWTTVEGPVVPSAIQVAGDVVAVVGRDEVVTWTAPGTPGPLGRATAATREVETAVLLPAQAPTHLALSTPERSFPSGIRLVPVDGAGLSYAPRPVLEPFSYPDRLAVDAGLWAVLKGGVATVGDRDGERFAVALGYSSAPYAWDLLCLHDDVLTWVADVAAQPTVHRAEVGPAGLGEPVTWPSDAQCTEALCTEDGLVMFCEGQEVRAYDLATGEARGAVQLGYEGQWSAGNRHDVALTYDDLVWGGHLGDDGLVALPWSEATLPLSWVGRPTLVGDELWAVDAGGLGRYDLLAPPLVREPVLGGTVNGMTSDADLGALVASSGGHLWAWRGETGGRLLGAWLGVAAFDVASADGTAIVRLGTSVAAVDLAAAWVEEGIATAGAGGTEEVVVQWRDPLVAADTPLAEVEVACAVTGGSCTVTSVDLEARQATVRWTLPAIWGGYELAVAVGTPRWFTSTVDRVTVESP